MRGAAAWCAAIAATLAVAVIAAAPALQAGDEEARPPETPGSSEPESDAARRAEFEELRSRIRTRVTEVRTDLSLDERTHEVPDVEEDEPPLPKTITAPRMPEAVGVEVPGRATAAEIALIVPEEALHRIVKQDLQTIAIVRQELANAVVSKKISEEVGERIYEAVERLSREGATAERLRGQKRWMKRIDINPEVCLDRLRKTAERSQEGAGRPRFDAASTLADEAFSGSRASRQGHAPTAPELSGVPAAADTPTLGGSRVSRVRIQPSGGAESFRPQGVKILIDEVMLAKVLRDQGLSAGVRELLQLEDTILSADDEGEVLRVLQRYTEAKKSAFLERFLERRDLGRPRVVSLRDLLDEVEPFHDRWEDRPAELRTLGGLTRIHGYVRHEVSGDLLLVGRVEPGDPPILLDDLSVGLRSVWRDRKTPACSLDPKDEDPSGPQYTRILGVPEDSPFALGMLEADYRMKRILFEAEGDRLDVPGFRSLVDCGFGSSEEEPSIARIWLYPVQPTSKSIRLGPGGSSVLFDARVQVLTERLVLSEAGVIGTGESDPVSAEAAQSFTRHYAQIAAVRDEFRRLSGLFDVVWLAKILWLTAPEDPLLGRLSALPYAPAAVPKAYTGVRVTHHRGGEELRLMGGCQIESRARWRSVIEAHSRTGARLAEAASAGGGTTGVTRDLPGVSLMVPDVTQTEGAADGAYLAGIRLLADGRFGEADDAFTRAVDADAAFAEAYAKRAIARFRSDRLRAAIWDAAKAIDLAPRDARFRGLFCRLLQEAGIEDALDDADDAARRSIAGSLLAEGWTWLQGEEPESSRKDALEAETLLSQSLELEPGNAFALALRAEARYRLGKHDESLQDANGALKLEPDNLRCILLRSNLRKAKGDLPGALADVTKGIDLVTDSDSFRGILHGTRWRIRFEQKDYEGAVADASAAISLRPRDWGGYSYRGQTYYTMARVLQQQSPTRETVQQFLQYCTKAIADLDEALRLGDSTTDAWFRKAVPKLKKDRAFLQKVLDTVPDEYR